MRKVCAVTTALLACALLITAGAACADGHFSCRVENPPQTAYVGGSDALYNATVTNRDTCNLYIVNPYFSCHSDYDDDFLSISWPGEPAVCIAPGKTWSGTVLRIHANYLPDGEECQVEFGWGFSIVTYPGAPFPTTGHTHDVLTIANAPTVPEPSSVLALLCGIGGMGGVVWRRKSA